MSTNTEKARLALGNELAHFVPRQQVAILKTLLRGEEGEHFAEIINGLVERISAMPQTYETDGQGESAIAYLHYFGGPYDSWVTEKDEGDGTDNLQLQAFGLVSIGYEPELGYIGIEELLDNRFIELDLYWTPKPLKECGR